MQTNEFLDSLPLNHGGHFLVKIRIIMKNLKTNGNFREKICFLKKIFL